MLDLAKGTGAPATPGRCYYVHCTGWLAANGHKFYSSRDTTPESRAPDPLGFPQGARAVILGWDVGGFEGMRVGGPRRLFIPQQLAYGERGFGLFRRGRT